jgi:sodium/potassium-transporting ATPase subunit alpha
MFVVLLTGTITFNQNAKSEAMMEGFKNMLPSQAKVLREGKVTQIAAEKLVRGDVIEIISGEKIPADIRVVQSN